MKSISNIHLAHLHTDEVLGFLTVVSEKTTLVINAMATQGVATFKEAVSAFADVLKPNASNTHTMSKKEADREVDIIWSGMRMYTDAMTRFPDDETERIALKAEAIIDKYGALNTMGYAKQYPNLQGLLADLSDIDSAELQSIGLDKWVNVLQTAYDNFMNAHDEQLTEDTAKGVGVVQDSRDNAQDGYYAFVQLINALVVVTGEADFAEFIDTINTLIVDYKALVKGRKTKAGS